MGRGVDHLGRDANWGEDGRGDSRVGLGYRRRRWLLRGGSRGTDFGWQGVHVQCRERERGYGEGVDAHTRPL
jgi:hypothetical protein